MNKKNTNTKQTSRGKAVKMVRCPYCGAEYKEGLLHCPYCGAVDDHQDESEFLEDLDELKDKLEDLPEDAVRQTKELQTQEAIRDLRRIFRRVGIIFAVLALLVGGSVFYDNVIAGNSEANQNKEHQERYLWKQQNYPKLDEMYEKGDYEGLLEFYYSETNGWFYDWEHYDLLQGLHLLWAVREGIPYADQAEELYGKDSDRVLSEQAALLSEELQLLYFDKQARNKEDIETIRGLSSEAIADLEARFAFTEDEQKSIQETINKNYGYISIRECEDFLKKRRDS